MKRRVMCFGTFDILHPGHIMFFEHARALGDELYVVVSQDKRRAMISGTAPAQSQADRLRVVGALKIVTEAIAGKKGDILAVVREVNPHVIALGHDQVYGIEVLEQWAASQKRPPQIVRLPAFKRARYASSRIKQQLCQHGK